MNTLFRESFTKDLRAMRDERLLRKVKEIIVAIEQAESPGRIANLERLPGVEAATTAFGWQIFVLD